MTDHRPDRRDPDRPDPDRLARKRARRKRLFRRHAALFLVVNMLTVGIWLMTQVAAGAGEEAFFWPGWILVPWLPLLVLHAFRAYSPSLDEQVARERARTS